MANTFLLVSSSCVVAEGLKKFKASRIVGFLVEPYSIKHSYDGEWNQKTTSYNTCNSLRPAVNDRSNFMTLEDNDQVIFTYDVDWQEDTTTLWAHRWDIYLK